MAESIPSSKAAPPTTFDVNTGERRVALALLFAAYTLSIADRMILSVLFEPLKAEFNLSDTQLGLLGGLTFALFYATLGVPIAKYADSHDRRPLIAACLLLFSLMTAASGLATGFAMLVLFRILVGVGEAGVNPASQSIVADYYPAQQRSLAMSTLTVGANVGMILGFLVGGTVSQIYGWRAAFFAVGLPGLIVGLLVFFVLKEPMRGAADGTTKETGTPGATILEAAGAMASSPVLRQVLFASTISGMVSYGVTQWLPAYFVRLHDLSQAQVGLVMACVFGVIGALGALTGGRLTDVLSRKRIDLGVKAIAICQAVAVPLIVLGYMSDALMLTLAFFIIPVFVSMFYLGPSLALIQTYSPIKMRALTAAIKMLCLNLIGLSLGPLIVGLISDALAPNMGPKSLSVALACVSVLSFWSAFHFWLAGNAMRKLEAKSAN